MIRESPWGKPAMDGLWMPIAKSECFRTPEANPGTDAAVVKSSLESGAIQK